MARRKRYGSYAWTDPKTKYLYARVRVKLPDGKSKTVYRRAENLTHAGQIAQEIQKEFEDRGKAYLDGRTMSLTNLAEWYKAEYVITPIYSNGQKVAGMRTWKAERNKIDRICEDIGHFNVNEVDEDDFRHFKLRRLKAGVSITTVNRDLETLRRMMRKAISKKWRKTVIDFSELIQKSLEQRRTVTINDDEFESIAKHAKEYSPELYALVCTLYDSGGRPSEIYPVNDYGADYEAGTDTNFEPIRWRGLFDENGNIVEVSKLTSMKGKQIETRWMVVTNRMANALLTLWQSLKHPSLDQLVFPQKTYKKSWDVIRIAAKLPTLRLRDIRRDWVTRLAKEGYSDRLAQHGAGHKRMQQTFDYTVFDYEAALQAKKILDK
jgi:integrase